MKRILNNIFILFFSLVILFFIPMQAFADNKIEAFSVHKKAVYLAKTGNFKEALSLIKDLSDNFPDNQEFASDYIVILAWSGRHRDAIAEYEKRSMQFNFQEYVHSEIAKCYRTTKDYNKALSIYKKNLDKNPLDREAMVGVINSCLDAKQPIEAKRFISDKIKDDKSLGQWLYLYFADVLFFEGNPEKAKRIYLTALKKDYNNVKASLGVAKILIHEKKYDEANFYIENVKKSGSNNIDTLFLEAEIFEHKKDFISAYDVYENILKISPDNQPAKNLKYRVLLELGCNSLVRERLVDAKDTIDPVLYQILLGNEAVSRIWWQEYGLAKDYLNNNIKHLQDEQAKTSLDSIVISKSLLRAYSDKICALSQENDMDLVIKYYFNLKAKNYEIYPWVKKCLADAYLYKNKPKIALKLYREILKDNPDFETVDIKLSIYSALLELGKYNEAKKILDDVGRDLPVQIIDRGILVDNWKKAEVSYNENGWFFIYQDKLWRAHSGLSGLLMRAPYNTHIRSSLAHLYLLRGWPRQALQESMISSNIDPEDLNNKISHCYILDANDKGKEARLIAKELLKKHPKNKNIIQLNRYFKIQDMFVFNADSSTTKEDPGVYEILWSSGFELPLLPHRKIFAKFVWRNDKENDLKQRLRREFAGINWRLGRDWWYTGSISFDDNGKQFGYFNQVDFSLNDYFKFNCAYDSYSLSVPIRARAAGVKGREGIVGASYRASEIFTSEAKMLYFDLSDGNQAWDYSLNLDRAIFIDGYWKLRLALAGDATKYRKTDVSYFSPHYLYSTFLTPAIEHTWYKNHNQSMGDRFYFGYGRQWQSGYNSQEVWNGRYEQNYKVCDLLSFLVGSTFSRKYYDGEKTDVWNIDFSLKGIF